MSFLTESSKIPDQKFQQVVTTLFLGVDKLRSTSARALSGRMTKDVQNKPHVLLSKQQPHTGSGLLFLVPKESSAEPKGQN